MRKRMLIPVLLMMGSLHSSCQSSVNNICLDDSISHTPACFEKIKDSSIRNFYRYSYKGQIWYMAQTENIKQTAPDKKSFRYFYDEHCKLVCTISRGGGFVNMRTVVPDSVQEAALQPYVPEKIKQLAMQKKVAVISICNYQNNTVYLISQKTVAGNRNTSNFVDEYYCENGLLIKINNYIQQWNLPRRDRQLIREIILVRL
ncbi:MAG: hypothetical protein ABIP30_09285 [Ferruginibacter sp.]